MSKENVVKQARESLSLLIGELTPDPVTAPAVLLAQVQALIMVAQAVDRLTELLKPVITEIATEIARQKAERP